MAASLDDTQITLSAPGRSVTVTGEQFDKAVKQLELGFPVNKVRCGEFLDSFLTIEDEIDRLKEEAAILVEQYKEHLPLRAVRTAIKVVRARKRLAEHHKEPMSYEEQDQVEGFVAQHMAALDAAKEAAAEALAKGQPVPDMTASAIQEG